MRAMTLTVPPQARQEAKVHGTAEFVADLAVALKDIQTTMMQQARSYHEAMTVSDITSFDTLGAFFSEGTGFVRAKWSGVPASEGLLKELGATIRCLPYEQSETVGRCVLTGADASVDAIFAKAY